MIVETPQLILRPVGTNDVSALVELDSDPAVMRYVSGGAPTPRAVIEDWVVPRAVAELSSRRGGGMWVALDRSNGAFVGWFSLRAPRHGTQPELELTYRLRRAAWGRGLATEGSQTLMRVAFDAPDTGRVFASTMAVNSASRRVMEKSGMRLTALHLGDNAETDGYERGEVEYELRRSDWESARFVWAVRGSTSELTA
ncbi:GCN5 family acetyltransferase [Williamsia sp. Leaf354]|uniref:GNAT family N-acetyltransferase n=1 Tax=Williamsia sp. Leaf354 TaxID=1736349 RepID=UPI0006F45255|nr:GNAT family N-acetyltransferase [Williamsia sp. Leaf354]KQR98481.1 GCN5 family acetyltransferase [Williamsia sp. Leaf354]